MPRPPSYRLEADHEGVRLYVLPDFWDNSIVDESGTTAIDYNIAQVLAEIRAALYIIATDGTRH